MLDEIRTKVRGPWAIAIVLIICIPFIMFGVESIFSIGSSGSNAVTVGDQDFSEQYIRQLMENQTQNNTQQDPAQLRKSIVDQLVDRSVLEQATEKMNLHVSDKDIELQIIKSPEFQENGKFSQARFDAFLAGRGISGKTYKDFIRRDLEINQMASIVEKAEFVTPSEVAQNTALFNQTRSGKLYTISKAKLMDTIKVDSKDVSAYYEQNLPAFMTDEKVAVDYIELKQDAMKVAVTEEEIKQAYAREIAQLQSQTDKSYSHIMLMAQDGSDRVAEMQAIRQSILGGVKFADAAREKSEDLGTKELGGDLGAIDLSALPTAFAQAAQRLKKAGEMSELVVSEAGVHLIQLNATKETPIPSLAERRGDISTQLEADKSRSLFQTQLDKLVDISFDAASLKEPAKALNLDVKTTEAFTRNGGQDAVTQNVKVITAAFGDEVLNQGHNSEVVELAPGHVIVLRLNKLTPSTQKSLDDVRTEVTQMLKNEKASEKLAELKEGLFAAVNANQPDSEIKTKYQAQISSFSDLKMTEPSKTLAPTVVRAAFDIPRPAAGKISTEMVNDLNNAYVVAVSDIKLADESVVSEDDKLNMQGTLKQFISLDSQNSFKQFMKDAVKIRIREAVTEEES